ncbi:MAG: N-acetyltransferase [Tannerella sp.]|jgi:predicted GNAT family acetyltransferase|nr:N-acetyltransferase [Tannerella sp.]
MDYKIVHLEDEQRFETEVDGYTGYVVYRIYDNCLDIIHTIVPQPIEGRGIAAALVKETYTYALEHNLRPQAACSYAAVWLKRNPEYDK